MTRKALSYPQWVKLGNLNDFTFVGTDTIAVGCGCHIMFYSLNENLETVYIANSKERGDGVECIAGQWTAPIFALAEKCLNPRILVFSYPAVEGAISILKGSTNGRYISMAFSEMEYLVTLSGIPNFTIMVWCWRTGVRLACKETGISSHLQQIRCSLSSPTLVCQLVKDQRRLLVWELNVCAKLCCLTRHEVSLPKKCVPVDMCFTTEGTLLFVDSIGDVFQVDLDEYTACQRITRVISETDVRNEEVEHEGKYPATCCMTFYKSGVLIAGPDNILRFYKRSEDWEEQWSLDLFTPLRWLLYLVETDIVLGWTFQSELIQVDCGKYPQVSLIKYYGNDFIDMQLVYPDGNTIVTVNVRDELQVWDKEDGHLVTISLGSYSIRNAAEESLRPQSKFSMIKGNPCYPYIGVAMSDGLLLLVSILYPTLPTTLAQFLLCKEEISQVHFAPAGDVFLAVTASTGQVFLIQGVPGQEMQVMAHLIIDQPVIDCILLPDESPVLAVLLSSGKMSKVGDKIAVYILESDGLNASVTSEMKHSYSRLVLNTKSKNMCYGAVYQSRQVHLLEVKSKVGVTFKEAVNSGHQLRHLLISKRVDYGLLTYGMDGMVIARPVGSRQQFYVVLPHHRTDHGVKIAAQDPKGEFVISLGCDNSLICSKLKRTAKYMPGSTEPSPQMVEKFSEPTKGFFLDGESAGITWLEHKENMKIAQEELQAAAEKSQIIEEFRSLQKKVVEMLEANEIAPPEEHLPVIVFDLDTDTRESAIENGRQERERQRAYTLALISVYEKKAELIKEYCWDPVKVKPTSIQSLVGSYKVDNYALLPETPEQQELLERVIEWRKLEMKANAIDSFHPWLSKTDSELAMGLTSLQARYVDEATRLQQALEEEPTSQEMVESEEAESPYVMSGSSLYLYVKPSPYHISQFELNTYIQTAHSIVLLKNDITNLQVWFNQQFQTMYQAKEKAMNIVKEIHDRLRHIFRELLLTCSVTHPDPDPTDPEWTQFEKPETIISVTDKEVGVEPYISPSQQELLQKKAEEEERIRQMLLADNFRELALIKMMDGVLEIRWEDELKKDVPKPKCMLEKEPEDFNEDDMRAVKDYEEKVAFLQSEREHYRKMLDSDYKRVNQNLKDSLFKFEHQLLELFDLKLRVEAACTQHTLRILRSRLLNPKRMLLAEKENTVRNMIALNQRALTDEQALVAQLQESTADCRTAYEAQLTRDKGLDSKFKKELPELSPVMLEVAFRLYRRRPKMQARALVSVTLMHELGRCVVACKKPPYLPTECLEILKGIDILDNASNAPPTMSPEIWTTVCRLRRQRIENEIKIKALALQIAEAESTVAIFQKNVKALKEKDKELQAQLRAVHDEQLLFEKDVEIQLVMKQGLVEIPLTGKVKDFENVILINRQSVASINDVIKAAGMKKMRAMRAACNFRRGIIYKEWEHRKMRMCLEDKEEELRTIESVKVTKEMQAWLYLRKKGHVVDRGMLALDREIARIKTGFERYIKMLGAALTDFDQRIAAKEKANHKIDKAITQINFTVNELQFDRNLEQESKEKEDRDKRMESIVLRAGLVRQVQSLHADILMLESELGGIRSKTYPILEHPFTN